MSNTEEKLTRRLTTFTEVVKVCAAVVIVANWVTRRHLRKMEKAAG